MQFYKKILPSGIRLITVPMVDTKTVTVVILSEVGSKYETKEQSGLSHFLEHMCFKGTTKRPQAKDISREIDGIGAQLNAFTSQEYTGYHVRAQSNELDQVFDVLSDMYLNSTLSADELAKEKGVIIEEINMYEDLPQRNVQDVFMELLYGDQPAGWNIAGSIDTVKGITREVMQAYYQRYTAPATTIVISGAFDVVHVELLIEKAFASLSKEPVTKKVAVTESQHAPQIKVKQRKTDQAHLVIGVRTFDMYDPRNRTLQVMTQLLGGGMSSRLFQEMREDKGLGYYVHASKDSFTDHGFMSVSAGVTTGRMSEAIAIILQEFKKLKDVLVSEEELNRVKQYIIGNMYLSLEGSEELAHFYGTQEILHKPLLTPSDLEQKIRAVTAPDIQALAKQIFVNESLNLAVVGDVESESLKALLLL